MRYFIMIVLMSCIAEAAPVDPNATNGIAAWDGNTVLCTIGTAWYFNSTTMAWEQPFDGAMNVPVPVAQIADWQWTSFTTHDGVHWAFRSAPAPCWNVMPPPPGCSGSVIQETNSFGEVKTLFR